MKTPYERVKLLIKEYENEINVEKLSGNIVKEELAKGIVLGLNLAMAEYEYNPKEDRNFDKDWFAETC